MVPTVRSIVGALDRVSRRWLRKSDPFRKRAARRLVDHSGLLPSMAESLLDGLFSELTEKKLFGLLQSEFKNPAALDGFAPLGRAYGFARGPALIAHLFPSTVANPAIVSFVLGMLVKSANVGKVSRRDLGILDIYLESLDAVAPKLARANALVRSEREWEKAARQAELVVAYGHDETIEAVRRALAPTKKFVGYGHRVSFALFFKEALKKNGLGELSRRAARDAWMADQRGCLSPVAFFVEEGGEATPEAFCGALSEALDRLLCEGNFRKDFLFARAARHELAKNQFWARNLKNPRARFWQSAPRGLWFLLMDEDLEEWDRAAFHETARIKIFRKKDAVFSLLEKNRSHLQAAALEASKAESPFVARRLARAGVNRICRAGRMQFPPLSWHHDGRLNLASWVTWCDWEK